MADVLTIGAFGWDEAAFFDALAQARVGLFCDIRRRRGVRGAEYAFVNSARLQSRLQQLGIPYTHRLDLAPSEHVRRVQAEADAREGIAKRSRSRLGDAFIAAYSAEHLAAFDARAFLDDTASTRPVCLFCVERAPAACHRSLLAAALERAGATVEHLIP
ncbi:MAG TPA: DUF488 domain-containing protein [Gaiellales bacterium]|nr:DUF488 domain-containing protein [Gaiellales bacterium]